MADVRLVASVGSSFAAGPNIEPMADVVAQRSTRNYAHQLAGRLGARLVDLTVSGATTANVLDTPQQMSADLTLAPQLDGVPADADVVTVTAGGNDLQFAGALLHVAWSRTAPDHPLVEMLGANLPDGIPHPTADAVEQATSGLVRVVDKARGVAPRARVILVDYLTVLDDDSVDATPFSADEHTRFRTIQHAIARVFGDAADRTGAELIRASVLSAGHALGSVDPWVQPFHPTLERTVGSFHPNEAGMTAVAVELERVLTTPHRGVGGSASTQIAETPPSTTSSMPLT